MKSFWRKNSGKALLFCGCLVFAGLFALSLFLDINAAILVIVAGFAGLLIKKLTGEATKNDAR